MSKKKGGSKKKGVSKKKGGSKKKKKQLIKYIGGAQSEIRDIQYVTWDWYFHFILNTTDSNEILYGDYNIYKSLNDAGATWDNLSNWCTRVSSSYGLSDIESLISTNIGDIIYNHLVICSIDIKYLIKLLLPLISPMFTQILMEFTELFDKFFHFIKYYHYETITEVNGSPFHIGMPGNSQRNIANYYISQISKFYTYIIQLEKDLDSDKRSGETTLGFDYERGHQFHSYLYNQLRDWCNTSKNGPWSMSDSTGYDLGSSILTSLHENTQSNIRDLTTVLQNFGWQKTLDVSALNAGQGRVQGFVNVGMQEVYKDGIDSLRYLFEEKFFGKGSVVKPNPGGRNNIGGLYSEMNVLFTNLDNNTIDAILYNFFVNYQNVFKNMLINRLREFLTLADTIVKMYWIVYKSSNSLMIGLYKGIPEHILTHQMNDYNSQLYDYMIRKSITETRARNTEINAKIDFCYAIGHILIILDCYNYRTNEIKKMSSKIKLKDVFDTEIGNIVGTGNSGKNMNQILIEQFKKYWLAANETNPVIMAGQLYKYMKQLRNSTYTTIHSKIKKNTNTYVAVQADLVTPLGTAPGFDSILKGGAHKLWIQSKWGSSLKVQQLFPGFNQLGIQADKVFTKMSEELFKKWMMYIISMKKDFFSGRRAITSTNYDFLESLFRDEGIKRLDVDPPLSDIERKKTEVHAQNAIDYCLNNTNGFFKLKSDNFNMYNIGKNDTPLWTKVKEFTIYDTYFDDAVIKTNLIEWIISEFVSEKQYLDSKHIKNIMTIVVKTDENTMQGVEEDKAYNISEHLEFKSNWEIFKFYDIFKKTYEKYYYTKLYIEEVENLYKSFTDMKVSGAGTWEVESILLYFIHPFINDCKSGNPLGQIDWIPLKTRQIKTASHFWEMVEYDPARSGPTFAGPNGIKPVPREIEDIINTKSQNLFNEYRNYIEYKERQRLSLPAASRADNQDDIVAYGARHIIKKTIFLALKKFINSELGTLYDKNIYNLRMVYMGKPPSTGFKHNIVAKFWSHLGACSRTELNDVDLATNLKLLINRPKSNTTGDNFTEVLKLMAVLFPTIKKEIEEFVTNVVEGEFIHNYIYDKYIQPLLEKGDSSFIKPDQSTKYDLDGVLINYIAILIFSNQIDLLVKYYRGERLHHPSHERVRSWWDLPIPEEDDSEEL